MTVRKLSLIAFSAFALMTAGRGADAGTITGLFSTGVAADGTLLAPNAVDPHYAITSSPLGAVAATVDANVPPVYTAPAPGSQFISSPGAPTVGNGTFVYTTTFTDTDSTGFLKGLLTADDTVSVQLNGVTVVPGTPDQGYGHLYPFTITTGFVTGLNTLTFTVLNTHGGPQALDVGISAVPEPASLAMAGLGLLGIAGVSLKARRKATLSV